MVTDTEKGNGHKEFDPGELLTEEEVKKIWGESDNVHRGADSVDMSQQKLGVLQRFVTAVRDDDNYRQILLVAAFDNKNQAMACARAIGQCKRFGATQALSNILDQVTALCSVGSQRFLKVLEATNNYNLHTFYNKQRNKDNQYIA